MQVEFGLDSNGKPHFEFGRIENLRSNKGKSILEELSDLTVIDIETTGLESDYCNIIELGVIKIRNHKIVDQYQTLINPEEEISKYIN